MNVQEIWQDIDLKLIAILRGIKPEETKECVKSLLNSGLRAIEIPLNSPDAFASIKIAAETASELSSKSCLIGAGTALTTQDVINVHKSGGNLIVSPNVNLDVIKLTKSLDMFSAPGVYTPSECLSASQNGADILKVFPASNLGAGGIKALSAILPKATQLCAVGGVDNKDFQTYLNAGVIGFGLGSSLYKAGLQPNEIATKARSAVEAFKNCYLK